MTFKPEKVKCSSCYAWICHVDTRTKAPTLVRQNARVDEVWKFRSGDHHSPMVPFPENVPDIKANKAPLPLKLYRGVCAKCEAVTRWTAPKKKIPPPPKVS